MAKKNELASKLGGERPQGWKAQIGGGAAAEPEPEPTTEVPESRRAGKYNRKTYLITPALEERIRALADREQVGQNELVRYLLTYSLDKIETGEHSLNTKPVQQRTLGV